jgi:hypothetical protein
MAMSFFSEINNLEIKRQHVVPVETTKFNAAAQISYKIISNQNQHLQTRTKYGQAKANQFSDPLHTVHPGSHGRHWHVSGTAIPLPTNG